MAKISMGFKRAVFLTGLDSLMNKTCFYLAGAALFILILTVMAGWALPSATRLFLLPAVAIIAIIITFLYNYSGLVIALTANFTAAALLYNHWSATGNGAVMAIISMLVYSSLGSLIIAFFKGKEEAHRQNLEWISNMDCLTEIYNHRYFQQRLTEEIARSKRNGSPVALLFIDLDNFKTFNDQNGHLLGDRVLKDTAQFLKKMVRIHDIVCRYGGDEFVIILPDTSAHEAVLLAKRLAQNYTGRKLPGKIKNGVKPTLSIGASSYPDRSRDLKELIQHADHALYWAKESGKGKAVTYEPGQNNQNGKTKALKANFCLNTCKHSLISGYRSLMKNTAAGEIPLPVKKADYEPGEINSDNIIIIGRALGLGHADLDRAIEDSSRTDDIKVEAH